jgi:hypothetical protein
MVLVATFLNPFSNGGFSFSAFLFEYSRPREGADVRLVMVEVIFSAGFFRL